MGNRYVALRIYCASFPPECPIFDRAKLAAPRDGVPLGEEKLAAGRVRPRRENAAPRVQACPAAALLVLNELPATAAQRGGNWPLADGFAHQKKEVGVRRAAVPVVILWQLQYRRGPWSGLPLSLAVLAMPHHLSLPPGANHRHRRRCG